MARSLWKGAISFGLVNVPVELFPAEERKEFEFSMLDKRDLSPVGYKRYSKKSGKEVSWNDIVKGYEYDKDRYVVLTEEDFRRANVKATRTIDIKAFVPAKEIPAQYFETPYYLVPSGRGEKVYALLRETLKQSGRVAVAQVVIRTTQHLAVVAPIGRALSRRRSRAARPSKSPSRKARKPRSRARRRSSISPRCSSKVSTRARRGERLRRGVARRLRPASRRFASSRRADRRKLRRNASGRESVADEAASVGYNNAPATLS